MKPEEIKAELKEFLTLRGTMKALDLTSRVMPVMHNKEKLVDMLLEAATKRLHEEGVHRDDMFKRPIIAFYYLENPNGKKAYEADVSCLIKNNGDIVHYRLGKFAEIQYFPEDMNPEAWTSRRGGVFKPLLEELDEKHNP